MEISPQLILWTLIQDILLTELGILLVNGGIIFMTNKKIIQVKNYTKKYGDFKAVNNISFDIYEGEIFGFVGPNGAGKSTTINTLCTILPKTSGEIIINDHNVDNEQDLVRNDIGVVFQDTTLDGNMTIEEILKMHCDFYQIPKSEVKERIDFVLELVDLKEYKKSTVVGLSGGMKRRLEIARGMLHYPKILFLDEPTTGLDPRSRENIWTYIRQIQKEKGITIFLTTHYMEEAEVCTHMAIIQNGQITAIDTPTNLKQKYTHTFLDISCTNEDKVKEYLDSIRVNYYPFGDRLRTEVKDSTEATEIIVNLKGSIHDFEFKHGTLNDVFLGVTEKGSRR